MAEKFLFYKDTITDAPYNFDAGTKLNSIRQSLITQGFFTSTESTDFRFMNYQNEGSSYQDMVVGLDTERFIPLNGISGKKSQVYLTDVNRRRDVDLLGFNTNWFFDRYMGCSITLNGESKAAALNAGKFPPFMLTNVKTANPSIPGLGAMDNVVVCEQDSIITFNIGSWGGAGFGFTIGPQAGTLINDSPLYVCFNGCPGGGNYATTGLSRYFSNNGSQNGQMIRVVPTSSLNIGDKTLQYMKFSIKTWKVNSYDPSDGGPTVTCNLPIPVPSAGRKKGSRRRGAGDGGDTPYGRITGGQSVIPGSTITPGSTVPAGEMSDQHFGSIWNVKDDNSPTGIIGEVVFYVFVFRSHDEAKAVFDGVNDIDPRVWQG
jgi:hypothetical protein